MTEFEASARTLADRNMGWGVTGVYGALEVVLPVIEQVAAAGACVRPVFSRAVASTVTRYGSPADWATRFSQAAGHHPLDNIPAVEPFGPRGEFDLFAIVPCSGATMARIACAITDDPVAFAAKGHLRNCRPLVLGVSTNDGLGLNARNLGALLATRHVYFVPFRQDSPESKPTSITADWTKVIPTIAAALEGRQLQPLILGPRD